MSLAVECVGKRNGYHENPTGTEHGQTERTGKCWVKIAVEGGKHTAGNDDGVEQGGQVCGSMIVKNSGFEQNIADHHQQEHNKNLMQDNDTVFQYGHVGKSSSEIKNALLL